MRRPSAGVFRLIDKLLENDDPTEEELEDFRAKAGAIFDLIAIDQGRYYSKARALYESGFCIIRVKIEI